MSAELLQQRERSRQSLLRANTAVALVILVVLGLALGAAWLGVRASRLGEEAERGQRRAEAAENQARSELWHAYLAEAKSTRLGDTLDRGHASLDLIRKAAEIAPAGELRKEAIAALALPEFELEGSLPYMPTMTAYEFDATVSRCAVGLTNGDVVIYQMKEGVEVQRFQRSDSRIPDNQGAPVLMEFTKDGNRLSVRYRGGGLVVWELSTGRTCFQHETDLPRGPTSRGRFSSDGKYIIGPVRTPRDGIAVLEVESGREVAYFPEFTSFRHVSVRPGFPMFAANDGTNVVVFNWETHARIADLPFEAGVRSTKWSRDGKQLAIAGGLLEVHVWDFEKRHRIILSGYKSDVSSVAFDPTGQRLTSTGTDGSSHLWSLPDQRLLGTTTEGHITHWGENDLLGWEKHQGGLKTYRLRHSSVYRRISGPVNQADPSRMDLSPEGHWAISAVKREGLLVWNLREFTRPHWIPFTGIYSACFDATQPKLWITHRGGAEERGYHIVTNDDRRSLALDEPIKLTVLSGHRLNLVTSSRNGKAVAWVELPMGRAWIGPSDFSLPPVVLAPVAFNSLADEWSSPRGSGAISFSPDGRWVVCGRGGPFAVKVCDTRTGALVSELLEQEADVQFSPDGAWVIAASGLESVLFNTSNWGSSWHKAQERYYPKFCAAFSPDSTTVAIAKAPHSVILFETVTGREITELEAPDPSPITSIRWATQDLVVLATRENHIEQWDLASLRQRLVHLKLDGNAPTPSLAMTKPHPASESRAHLPIAWIGFSVVGIVGGVAGIALVSLRRHRRLIEDYTRTEALASQRETELEGEREVSRLKSSFVSMVSHEFRTPLGIIQSSAQILDRYLEKLPTEQRREQLRSITQNVRRMSHLIDEVLLLGKAEAGQMQFMPAPMALEDFCIQLVDEMHSATRRQCPIQLQSEPMPVALCDESLLRHMLSNLLSNAVKYSPPGSPVHMSLHRHGNHAVIEITDQGLGIPKADQGKLFTAFHRASNVRNIGGTGLGLTIVSRCVALHQGEIAIESQEGSGTRVTLRLPVFEPAELGNTPSSAKFPSTRTPKAKEPIDEKNTRD